jgi:ribulose-5-phosphate 4-epimerase/fuculose-1-phosphate aldolase
MKEEGVIKFNCNWIKSEPLNVEDIKELNDWRDKLYNIGLIGVKEGIGYGNISIRFQQNRFIITGSGTGKFKKLTAHHYTQVTDYNLEENTLTTTGPVKASSESLTHAAIYQCEKDINAVIHVHHFNLWNKLLKTFPATSSNVEYGTPAMAAEVLRLFTETNLSGHKIFAMAGHEEGIISFGKDLDEAGEILLEELIHL